MWNIIQFPDRCLYPFTDAGTYPIRILHVSGYRRCRYTRSRSYIGNAYTGRVRTTRLSVLYCHSNLQFIRPLSITNRPLSTEVEGHSLYARNLLTRPVRAKHPSEGTTKQNARPSGAGRVDFGKLLQKSTIDNQKCKRLPCKRLHNYNPGKRGRSWKRCNQGGSK